ncbi:MAG: hypothetical protein ACOCXG_03300 [Nanoarchaeota archaeon]
MAIETRASPELMNYIKSDLYQKIQILTNTKGDFTQNFQFVGELKNLLNTILSSGLVAQDDWKLYGISFDSVNFGFLEKDSQKFARQLSVLLRTLDRTSGRLNAAA